MSRFICDTCGTQHADSSTPPVSCAICSDERQYVGWAGQGWTSHEELVAVRQVKVGVDDGVTALRIAPEFGIGQRALFVRSPGVNVLWESLSIVTAEAVEALNDLGGVDAIAISHPHFYTSMVEWSAALGNVPILIHIADQRWVQRPSQAIEFWTGATARLGDAISLVHLPGHFPGSSVLHWRTGPQGRPALLSADSMHVAADRRHLSFMYSYPNHVPLGPSVVARMRDVLAPYEFEDVYGFSWGRNIIGQAKEAVASSFDRYFAAVER